MAPASASSHDALTSLLQEEIGMEAKVFKTGDVVQLKSDRNVCVAVGFRDNGPGFRFQPRCANIASSGGNRDGSQGLQNWRCRATEIRRSKDDRQGIHSACFWWFKRQVPVV